MNLNQFRTVIGGELHIELTKAPSARACMPKYTVFAEPDAKIKKVRLEAYRYDEDYERISLTRKELSVPIIRRKRITLIGEAGIPIKHEAPNGEYFTVGNVLKAVEKTERLTRKDAEWFGGIDCHHIYFEGIRPKGRGVYTISWGS